MNISDPQHERYKEFCAVFAEGSLTGRELRELKEHVDECETCRDLLADYSQMVHMIVPATAAPNLEAEEIAEAARSMHGEKQRLFARIARREGLTEAPATESERVRELLSLPYWLAAPVRYAGMTIAASLLVVAGYVLGLRRHAVVPAPNSPGVAIARPDLSVVTARVSEQAKLEPLLRAREKEIASLNGRIESSTKEIQRLQALEDVAQTAHDASNAETARLKAENATLVQSRGEIERLSEQAKSSLASLQQELERLRAERERGLTETAELRNQIAALTAENDSRERTIAEQRKLLDADKDIRDLMGARDLYIADVYDVDGDDRTPKPFGRVFYTKHKTLTFYAFDLDREPGVRSASTFQAWGVKDGDKTHALSMGVFFKDDDVHRRWVLKFENPQVLDQIQAVFVTVEPKGGSHTPRGPQLLYASLRMTPNHP